MNQDRANVGPAVHTAKMTNAMSRFSWENHAATPPSAAAASAPVMSMVT